MAGERGATLAQLIRYGLVGLGSNLLLYLAYLLLTGLGLGPKWAMSSLYVVGVLQTFYFNRKWTFAHVGRLDATLMRYCASYGLGYLVNLLALQVLADQMGYPHQAVQGVMILVLAVMLFLLQKFWVFRDSGAPSNGVV